MTETMYDEVGIGLAAPQVESRSGSSSSPTRKAAACRRS